MPFTFSHPAIVLPLARLQKKYVSLTGLVVGSMTPDFEYFIQMRVQSDYSHTLSGILWFDLPLGILLCFIFQYVVRDALFEHLPTFLRSRVVAYGGFYQTNHFRRHWPAIVASILTGALSHIVWDGFTHHSGYFVQQMPFLMRDICQGVPVFKLLQHTSSLAGGAIILWAIWQLPPYNVTRQENSIRYWGTVAATAGLVTGLRILTKSHSLPIGDLIVSGLSAGMVGLVVAGLGGKLKFV